MNVPIDSNEDFESESFSDTPAGTKRSAPRSSRNGKKAVSKTFLQKNTLSTKITLKGGPKHQGTISNKGMMGGLFGSTLKLGTPLK